MRFYIFLLILAAFLQTAFLPVNICLILIVVRSYVVEERQNYYLAFFTGVFLSVLYPVNMGFWTVFLLLAVKAVHAIRRFPITAKGLTILPVSVLLMLVSSLLEQWLFKTSFSIVPVVIGGVISLPIYYAVRLWEERFVVKREIKLRI